MKNMELKKEVMMEKYCIAIMGSPQCPEHEWTDERLEELKNLGFNTMQLNIAWGGRPNDEALNLEDILLFPERIKNGRRRYAGVCRCARNMDSEPFFILEHLIMDRKHMPENH